MDSKTRAFKFRDDSYNSDFGAYNLNFTASKFNELYEFLGLFQMNDFGDGESGPKEL